MTPDQQQNFYVQLLGALLISTVSGAISVGRRILRYGQVTFVAAATEMSAALLAGYLAWDAYPVVASQLPTGITQPIFICTRLLSPVVLVCIQITNALWITMDSV